jgi:hypothetical protein
MPGITSSGWEGPPRRAVITGIPAAAVVIGLAGCTSAPPHAGPVPARFFSRHQAAVVADATARIAPGPGDDPSEAGHPGAREAGVTGYIDAMLGALTVIEADNATHGTSVPPVPVIFAGGPWSSRHAAGPNPAPSVVAPDPMASFIPLDLVSRIAWRKRLTGWRTQYTSGIAALDKMAGGDFTKASPAEQDKILASAPMKAFLALLFEHTIEGMYAAPEYGGNRGLAGWKEISYPGDSQPLGYTGDEVERSDGHDPVEETAVVADVLKLLGAL